ncbi:MAG: hypothetical protein ACXW6T_11990, partial [Candidatus Binatia bacterium]
MTYRFSQFISLLFGIGFAANSCAVEFFTARRSAHTVKQDMAKARGIKTPVKSTLKNSSRSIWKGVIGFGLV